MVDMSYECNVKNTTNPSILREINVEGLVADCLTAGSFDCYQHSHCQINLKNINISSVMVLLVPMFLEILLK